MVPNLTATGTRAAGTRVLTGTVTVYHQIAQYTATQTFNTVTWGDTACCYPTSGSISGTYTTNSLGLSSSTLTFSSTCGAATWTDSTSGTSSSVTLKNCQ